MVLRKQLAVTTNASSAGRRGVSLMEVIVVVSLVSVAAGMTLFINLDSYRGYLSRSDRELLIVALHHARSQAVGNVCLGTGCTNGRAHGVAIREAEQEYVIFQAAATSPFSYATRDVQEDIVIPINAGSTFSGSLTEVVFSPLSGNAVASGSIEISAHGRTSIFTIGTEGQILWTH